MEGGGGNSVYLSIVIVFDKSIYAIMMPLEKYGGASRPCVTFAL
jgi:hypothetical protein